MVVPPHKRSELYESVSEAYASVRKAMDLAKSMGEREVEDKLKSPEKSLWWLRKRMRRMEWFDSD